MYINYSKLWSLLAEKGMSKSDLMELTGLSSRVIAKLSKNETVTTDTVAKICSVLNCDVGDVMECSSESSLTLYQYSRRFGTALEDGECVRKIAFVRNGQKYVLYFTKKSASKATRIDCGTDGTLYWTQYYIAGGHGNPSVVKKPLLKPGRLPDEIAIVVIKGQPGTISGLDEGIWVSAKNGKLRDRKQIFVMSEAAFKLFHAEEKSPVSSEGGGLSK
ncbi:MAG: helix-turn-helix transcriptional regulator [Clostridia bacterium]|nr:helix-turn-helix transcriptional regulator [Clostridia bacterium]